MLWTLHDRVHEALRPGGRLFDPDAVRIYHQIDVDLRRRFGPPLGVIGLRSAAFDRVVQRFVDAHPSAVVVNLGEGLETQRYRIRGDRLWITVDLPDAIQVRERFIAADDDHWHISASATDPDLFDIVPPDRPTLLTAQGLFMYLHPHQVRDIVVRFAERFPGGRIVFDTMPGITARLSALRLPVSPRFRLPPMPFGLDQRDAAQVLGSWVRGVVVGQQPLPFAWSPARLAYGVMRRLPGVRHRMPGIVVADVPRR